MVRNELVNAVLHRMTSRYRPIFLKMKNLIVDRRVLHETGLGRLLMDRSIWPVTMRAEVDLLIAKWFYGGVRVYSSTLIACWLYRELIHRDGWFGGSDSD